MLLDDQPVGLVEAAQVLELPVPPRENGRLPVVVASDRSHRFGVVVDQFLGERDLRVTPLDPRLGKVPNLNSSSVLENGWPVLIIDVEDLIRSIDNLLSGRRIKKLTRRGRRARGARGPQAGPRRGRLDHRPRARAATAGEPRLHGGRRRRRRRRLERGPHRADTTWSSATSTCPGWTASSSCRTSSRTPGCRPIPVIIVSYKDREEDRIRGLDAGANFYLTKSSFHDQTFLDTVVDLIGEAES